MSQAFTESYRQLLYVLFWLFETLLVAVVVIVFCIDPRKSPGVAEAAGLTYWFAFLGLFAASFIVRRTCRRLAVIGWISLLVWFWSMALWPVV